MVTLMHLWLPLIVASAGVFIASSLIHMVFKWHQSDYGKLGNEDEIVAAIRRSGAGPGQYTFPHCMDMKEMQSAEMQKKFTEGPIGSITLRQPGLPNMGKHLGQWFALTLLVSAFAACVCATAFGPGAAHGPVMHVAGMLAFAGYGFGSITDGIWWGRPWSGVAKDLLDALIYAAITGASFAMLWPQ